MKNKYVHEAYSAIFQQDFKRAIDSFRKAIKIHPKNHSLYYKLSITYARNQNLQQAIEAIQQAIHLSPEKPSYLIHLQSLKIKQLAREAKKALENKSDVEPFIEPLLESIELDPLQIELKWILGLIYMYLEDDQKAEEQMLEILKIDPEHNEALHYIKNRSEQKRRCPLT